jgi:branched-chain amino acid transport system ATP-binding protein
MLKEQKISIIIIEHNMNVAMKVCDRLVVLNFGEKIAEGTPKEIQNNPWVIKAYLGEEE